jgi:hypothetical protein
LVWAAVAHAADPLTPLGQAFEVNTPWKAKAGDDPRWARPDFNDSAWLGDQALATYDGFAWYRMAVRLPDRPGPHGLWIPRVLRAAEFFVNGQKLGEHGSVDRWYLERRDLVEPLRLPAGLRGGDLVHIAVRVQRSSSGPGIAGRPVIGDWNAVSAAYRLALFDVYRQSIVSVVMLGLTLIPILLGLIYWRGKAERQEALWVSGLLLSYFFLDFEAFRGLGSRQGWTLMSSAAVLVSLWAAWRFFHGAPSIPWRTQAPYLALLGSLWILTTLGRMNYVPWVHVVVLLTCAIALMLVRNGIDAWRRGRQGEVWILWFFGGYLLATLGALVFYAATLQRMLTGTQVGIGGTGALISDPVRIDLRNVGELVSFVIMVGLLVRRFVSLQKEQQALAGELEAARQVQDLLLPAANTNTPGFTVESMYLPAQRVGGDFYFIQPLPEGALLVVVGDVSGKGLKAAMLVSVVVGILRAAPATSASEVLRALNAGLVGRTGGGFVTAASLLLAADGSATIVNAGHCPVYRDGAEVVMAASLPLGLVADASFDELTVAPGRFVLVSDGVVEAENSQRELFGFDRTREISARPAAEVAEVARAWGQNDDITVVTVRRLS